MTRWCAGDWVTSREHFVVATVWAQNVKFSSCHSIPSTPSCHCRTWFLIQVTVLSFSYLCTTRRYQNFYRVHVRLFPCIADYSGACLQYLLLCSRDCSATCLPATMQWTVLLHACLLPSSTVVTGRISSACYYAMVTVQVPVWMLLGSGDSSAACLPVAML